MPSEYPKNTHSPGTFWVQDHQLLVATQVGTIVINEIIIEGKPRQIASKIWQE